MELESIKDAGCEQLTGTVTNCNERFDTAILTAYRTLKAKRTRFCLDVNRVGV